MSTLEQQLETEVQTETRPSPNRFFETMQAYQRTAALKTAIELELFTAIGETSGTVAEISKRIGASERGVRALCDFLVVLGFIGKDLQGAEARYIPTAESAAFLDKRSRSYIGLATTFMGSPTFQKAFSGLTGVVRAGGPLPDGIHVDDEVPVWIDFARGMASFIYPVAEETAKFFEGTSEAKILDVAASHGLFGIAVAKRNPNAKIVALDYPSVLGVAVENAQRFGVSDRHTLLPGDALQVPFGSGFDGVLVSNLLHHWDRPTIIKFLKKAHAALKPGGRIVIVEFAPNDDRVSPPMPASFVLNMLVLTPGGDAYTVAEHVEMLRAAGFSSCESHDLLPTPQTAIVATRN